MENGDVIATLEALKRRRQLLGQQQQMNMETPIVGNTGLGQLAAKLGTAWLLKGADDKLKTEDSVARQQYGTQLKSEAGQYLDTFEGRPGVDLPSVGMTNVGGQKSNPREAVINAMASQLPEIQAMGKAGMAELSKGKEKGLTQKDILALAGYDPKSKVLAALSGNIAELQADPEFITAEGQIFNKRELGKGPAVDARMRFKAPERMGGDLYQTEDRPGGQTRKLDNAPKISLSATVDKGEDAFATALGKDLAEEFKQARQQAQSAYRTKGVVKQLQSLESSGVYNTPVPGAAIALGNFSQALGLPVDHAKLANSEAFQQQVAKQVADVLIMGGGVGRSMTDEDRKAFAASLPQLLMSPQGRNQVYNMLNSAADQSIIRAQSMNQQLKQNPKYKDTAGMLTFNPVDQQPAPGAVSPEPPVVPSTASPSAPMSLDQYLKSKLGSR